jgi:AmmeMemoRadiSam system protein A
VPPEDPPAGPLRAAGAAFVTLTRGGRLRGCIGYTEALHPLYRTVQECAVAAATEDPRFPRVKEGELDSLRVEVSVLTPLAPVRPEDVVVGLHGLVVERGGRKGLLLPQVALEYGWDREAFLARTCEKAGLPPEAWRQEGTRILGFTAQVFGEGETT